MSINISAEQLTKQLSSALDHSGSLDFSIYVNRAGNVDLRNNTENNQDWVKVIDTVTGPAIPDEEDRRPGEYGYDNDQIAEYIVSEYDILPPYVEFYDTESESMIRYLLNLVSTATA